VRVSFTTPNGSKPSVNPRRRRLLSKWTKVRVPIPRSKLSARSRAAYSCEGVTTAGNSSQMSDGAAAAVVMSSERAKALGITPLARYVSFATAGYKPEEMGLGPVFAIPKALKLAG